MIIMAVGHGHRMTRTTHMVQEHLPVSSSSFSNIFSYMHLCYLQNAIANNADDLAQTLQLYHLSQPLNEEQSRDTRLVESTN